MNAELKSLEITEDGFTALLVVDSDEIAQVTYKRGSLPRFTWLSEKGLIVWDSLLTERGTSGAKMIIDLASASERKIWMRKQCETKTLFRLKDDPEKGWRCLPKQFTDEVKAFLETTFGGQIDEIANEQFL